MDLADLSSSKWQNEFKANILKLPQPIDTFICHRVQLLKVISNICIFTVGVNVQFDSATVAVLALLEDCWITYNLWHKHDLKKCPNYCSATLCHVSRGKSETCVPALTSFSNRILAFIFNLHLHKADTNDNFHKVRSD